VINKYKTIIDKFIHWGKSSDKLYAALMIGSQSRKDHQADEYSDLDINLFRLISVEVAEKLKFKYPKEADEFSTKWVGTLL